MPAQPLLILAAGGDEIFAMVDQQANIHGGAVEVRCGELVGSFPQRGARDRDASIQSDLPRSRDERRAPAMCLGRRARFARRGRPSIAPTRRTRAGSPRSPTRARGRACAPTAAACRSCRGVPTPSSPRARRPSMRRPRRRCGCACVCPSRSRSCVRPFDCVDEADCRRTRLTAGSCQAPIRSRRWSSGGDGRHDIR
jgi:hypothetical protein